MKNENETQIMKDKLMLTNCMSEVSNLMARHNMTGYMSGPMLKAGTNTIVALCEMWYVIEPDCAGGIKLRADDEVVQ